jgi:hypothetical protein
MDCSLRVSCERTSYSGMKLVDKLRTDYNPCLTPVSGLLTSYMQTTIHVLLWTWIVVCL